MITEMLIPEIVMPPIPGVEGRSRQPGDVGWRARGTLFAAMTAREGKDDNERRRQRRDGGTFASTSAVRKRMMIFFLMDGGAIAENADDNSEQTSAL